MFEPLNLTIGLLILFIVSISKPNENFKTWLIVSHWMNNVKCRGIIIIDIDFYKQSKKQLLFPSIHPPHPYIDPPDFFDLRWNNFNLF